MNEHIRRRKGKPYHPVHDRRATDLLCNAMVAPIEVDDPYEPESKLLVMRSVRDDPLALLHARGRIDEAQYQAGRAFQSDFETAERGPRAIDPGREAVDGGLAPEAITEGQRKAARRLARVHADLGLDGSALTSDVLIARKTYEQIARARGLSGSRWEDYFARRFRECLDCLALVYGFATAK